MITKRLYWNDEDMALAGSLIRNGELVAFPTETVYGLGANALNADAVRSVYEAKGRPSDNPMIVHISEGSQLTSLVKGGSEAISEDAIELMEKFWPGPLTMIFPKSELVPDVTTGGLDTVAVRMPADQIALEFIDAAGVPIAAPSANLSGKPSPTTPEDVLEDMDGRIAAVIMGDQCEVGIESTVVDLTGEEPVVLRPGVITAELLSFVLGKEVHNDKSLYSVPDSVADPEDGVAETQAAPKSPGMKYRHYSPNAKVRLVQGSEEEFRKKVLALGLEARKEGLKVGVLDYGADPEKAAHKLFADLREMDRQKYDLILIRSLEEVRLGFSVMNRMLKSAGYDVVKE